jgi:predicted ester cyclase/ketosteroid isomerase-like protein
LGEDGTAAEQQLKQALTMYRTAFPDLSITVEDMISEGDKVVVRNTWRGTQQGDLGGIVPPTGERMVTMPYMEFYRIVDGKIVEIRAESDMLTFLEFLGVVPGAPLPAAVLLMMKHKNTLSVRRAIEAFQKGDATTIRELFANEAVWHLPGKSSLAGEHKGIEAIVQLSEKIVEMTAGTLREQRLEPVFLESEATLRCVLWHSITAERNSKTLDISEAILCSSGLTDGKIMEVWHRPEQHPFDEFFS